MQSVFIGSHSTIQTTMLSCPNPGACQVFSLLLSLLYCLTTILFASAAPTTLFGRSNYHHQVTLDSSFSPLEYLATFDLGYNGTFELVLDVSFPMFTLEDGDDRVMLYLLACDESVKSFLNLPSASRTSSNETSVPTYCAMANHSLDFYCHSFALENQSPDNLVYQSKKTITGSVNNITLVAKLTESISTKLTFYIDACELLGGEESILRSCLEYPPPISSTQYSRCYYCPEQFPDRSEADGERWSEECIISSPIREPVEGIVGMELCKANGQCMWETDTYLVVFYAASSVLWGVWGFAWIWHMHFAPSGSIVALHYKLVGVPITQVIYAIFSFAAKYTAGHLASLKFNMIAVTALLAQVVALAESAEVALFVAAGWGITQKGLERIDIFRIRCVSIEWALAFVVLKQLEVDNIGIAIVWGISWFSIVFLIHYYSTANLKMLRLRYRIGEQMNIDTSLVRWKGTLFLHFRRLQKGFVFIATLTALTGSDNRWRIWEWVSVQGHEILIFLLYSVLGYICRCQRFRFSELENLEIEVGTGVTSTQENGSADSISSANVVPVIVEPVRKKVATALILNPDKSVLLGTAYAFAESADTDTPLTKESEVRISCEADTNPSSSPRAPSDSSVRL